MICKQHLTLFFLGEVNTSGETERNKFHWDKTRLDAPVSFRWLDVMWKTESFIPDTGFSKSSPPEVFCKKDIL